MITEELEPIKAFRGEHAFLSNFWPVEVSLQEDFNEYNSVEAAFQAAKTDDLDLRTIFQSLSPKQAKRHGRSLKLRGDWEAVKLQVMEQLLQQKFSRPELKERLLETGSQTLIEGNWWGDRFWGVCHGEGENWLGKLIMQVRDSIREAL